MKRKTAKVSSPKRKRRVVKISSRPDEALRESQALYHSLVEHMPAGVFRKDVEGRYVFVNSVFCRLKGLKADEILGKSPHELAAYESATETKRRPEFSETARQRTITQGADHHELIMRTGKSIEVEEIYPQPDGRVEYFHAVKSPVFASNGRVIGSQGILFDITAHKRAEQALQQEQERFNYVTQATNDAIYDWDMRTGKVWRNATYQMLFLPDKPVSTDRKWWHKNVHPDDLARIEKSFRSAFENRNHFWSDEYRLRKPDGSYATVMDRGYIIYDLDGKPVRKIGAITDITARKRAEDELFESQQMLRKVLDTIPQRVFWKDKNSVYVGCNQPLAQDCGFDDPAELIGKTDYETKSAATADLYRSDDRRVMETGESKINYEEPQVKADGQRGWLRTSKVPLYDKHGNVIGVLGTYEDITERKRLEEQLRQAQKMDAFGQLAAGVAHDFNNILTVIQGNLSLLRMGLNSKADETSAIDQALAASERAANLTRQLLTFGRRQPLQPKPLDLNEVVANMTKMLQRLIGEHIALEAHYAPGGAPVMADVNMMEQVLINLAVNSRDAMLKGGKLVVEINSLTLDEQDIETLNKKAGEFIRFSVTDDGCGIAPEHLPHIFEPFFTTKDIGKGTGLGLATVFGIVEQHDGWIKVESKIGEGTTFHVYLPRLSKDIQVQMESPSAPRARGGSETILLVEDEMPVRELMRLLLTRAGYKIHEAASGHEALKLWNVLRDQIDLLITDMVMPDGIAGHELAEKLCAEKSNLKVIYCSGYSDDILGKDSPVRNSRNFLEKPFEPQKLLRRVRDCLDGA